MPITISYGSPALVGAASFAVGREKGRLKSGAQAAKFAQGALDRRDRTQERERDRADRLGVLGAQMSQRERFQQQGLLGDEQDRQMRGQIEQGRIQADQANRATGRQQDLDDQSFDAQQRQYELAHREYLAKLAAYNKAKAGQGGSDLFPSADIGPAPVAPTPPQRGGGSSVPPSASDGQLIYDINYADGRDRGPGGYVGPAPGPGSGRPIPQPWQTRPGVPGGTAGAQWQTRPGVPQRVGGAVPGNVDNPRWNEPFNSDMHPSRARQPGYAVDYLPGAAPSDAPGEMLGPDRKRWAHMNQGDPNHYIDENGRRRTQRNTPIQKRELNRLTNQRSQVRSNSNLAPDQMDAAEAAFDQQIYANSILQDTPEALMPEPMESVVGRSMMNAGSYQDLPWTTDADGKPQLPRGFTPPKSEWERLSEAKMQKLDYIKARPEGASAKQAAKEYDELFGGHEGFKEAQGGVFQSQPMNKADAGVIANNLKAQGYENVSVSPSEDGRAIVQGTPPQPPQLEAVPSQKLSLRDFAKDYPEKLEDEDPNKRLARIRDAYKQYEREFAAWEARTNPGRANFGDVTPQANPAAPPPMQSQAAPGVTRPMTEPGGFVPPTEQAFKSPYEGSAAQTAVSQYAGVAAGLREVGKYVFGEPDKGTMPTGESAAPTTLADDRKKVTALEKKITNNIELVTLEEMEEYLRLTNPSG